MVSGREEEEVWEDACKRRSFADHKTCVENKNENYKDVGALGVFDNFDQWKVAKYITKEVTDEKSALALFKANCMEPGAGTRFEGGRATGGGSSREIDPLCP